MSTSEPTVTVVCVARGEPADRLARAAASVAAQSYRGEIELVVAAPISDRHALPTGVRWVDNPGGGRSAGLNAAVALAKGDVVCRVDARSQLPTDYVRRCVDRLQQDASVAVVGGIQRPAAVSGDRVARGIARALRNRWVLGGADYRCPGRCGRTDTVYLGAFRRHDLDAVGGWDETLEANEDFELCQRFRATGATVWLEDVEVDYEPRARLGELAKQYVAFGRSKVRYWRRTGNRPNRRQWVALLGAPVGVALAPLAIVLDHIADPHERDLEVRAVASFAYLLIVGGWLYGVVAELLRRSPASAPARPLPVPR